MGENKNRIIRKHQLNYPDTQMTLNTERSSSKAKRIRSNTGSQIPSSRQSMTSNNEKSTAESNPRDSANTSPGADKNRIGEHKPDLRLEGVQAQDYIKNIDQSRRESQKDLSESPYHSDAKDKGSVSPSPSKTESRAETDKDHIQKDRQ